MTTQIKRVYKGKDVEMLTATSTIIEHAIKNKLVLIAKRATWADPFFDDINTRIDNAFEQYLGVDNAKKMREATQFINNLQSIAIPLLAEFKVQINADFTNPRRTEILTQLGFTEHHKAAQRGDQEALIELLFKFKLNMTPALQTEITAPGMDPNTIVAISDNAQKIKDSNISQEALKGGRKVISAAGVNEFNEIYTQVIGIAKISAKIFIKTKPIAQGFSYSKAIKAQNFNPPPPQNP